MSLLLIPVCCLHLSLIAGVNSGDEVITTPFTLLQPVTLYVMGAKPVFVDDPKTFNIDRKN
jgi:dTDP-4-amino-4,6-dideoxygalactose transaminase